MLIAARKNAELKVHVKGQMSCFLRPKQSELESEFNVCINGVNR